MTKVISGFDENPDDHEEATRSRIETDYNAIDKMVNVVNERMINPFQVEPGSLTNNRQPLVNIATSRRASEEVTQSLLTVRESGKTEMNKFVSERINTDDTLPKPSFKTFASHTKTLSLKGKQGNVVVNIDRESFSKLISHCTENSLGLRTRSCSTQSLLH